LSAEALKFPLLSILLVNYNDGAHLPECLSSIETNVRTIDHEVIVVDNASTDGSPELIAERFPRIRLIRNSRNEGFGRANNKAVREGRGTFILFLNTDVVLHPGALDLLLAEMAADPRAGIVGPALINPGDSFQVSFGGRVGFFTEAFKKIFLNRAVRRSLRKGGGRREVGWVSGAFLLARKRTLLDAGLFDENFFLYFEDIDLCRRAVEKGWKVIFLPRAVSFHVGGATTAGRRLRSRLEYRKSQLLFYRKHNSRASLALLRLYLKLNFAALSLSGAFRKEPGDLRREFMDLLAAPARSEHE
jgi:GT2 family glycosyltransferase